MVQYESNCSAAALSGGIEWYEMDRFSMNWVWDAMSLNLSSTKELYGMMTEKVNVGQRNTGKVSCIGIVIMG